jgi:hypothetical protein
VPFILAFYLFLMKRTLILKQLLNNRKMKNLILLTAFVFGFSAITLEKKSHDFGTIEEGVQATITFTFKNTGNAPLVLNSVKASCGCTTPKWTKEPIAPGEEGVITAIYNSKGRPGNFTKTITVKHNGEGGTEFLTIRGVVNRAAPVVQPTVVSPEQ